jgi:hypothetical protein
MTKLPQALTIYRRHHPQPDPAQLASIERLITAEGAAFDLAKWTRVCARIAAKRLRGRADLVIADYRRSRGAPILGREQAAAYQVLRTESEQAEAERQQSISQMLAGEVPAG